MKVAVVGTGYVGLVSGVCLAETGHEVLCVDNDLGKVEKINSGVSPIYEKGLDELLQKNIGTRLKASSDLAAAVTESDISLIAVGTPFDGNEIDLKYIRQVSAEIGEALKEVNSYHVVVVKSTVVPGTTDSVVLPILERYSGKKAGKDFGVGMNPEFLREGAAIEDFMCPDRIVVGGIDENTRDVLAKVYAPFTDVDVLRTNNKTAEMIKYTANSLLATLISFSNEIGNLCAAVGGIDALEVMGGVHLDKRVSPILENGERVKPILTTYLEAGCGFGGSCFPKDVKALISHGKTVGRSMELLSSVININKHQPQQVLDRLYKHFSNIEGVRVAVLGLAFKPDTDDMRESPAIPIVSELVAKKADVRAYDPVAEEEAKKIFVDGGINYCSSINEVLEGANVVLLLTRWSAFEQLPETIRAMNINPVVIDGRRMFPAGEFERYEGIGLGL
ncbi:MAG TPA: UDP-glucose/GDP-mannose dehydrogenase family protein [Gammaproteobacteria bacterium]|nr:UDP-glucose/GDP-mannose dehydrogenase family protein [Gammaproteobacteria bacterium]